MKIKNSRSKDEQCEKYLSRRVVTLKMENVEVKTKTQQLQRQLVEGKKNCIGQKKKCYKEI